MLLVLEMVVCASAMGCGDSYPTAAVIHGQHWLLHNAKSGNVGFVHLPQISALQQKLKTSSASVFFFPILVHWQCSGKLGAGELLAYWEENQEYWRPKEREGSWGYSSLMGLWQMWKLLFSCRNVLCFLYVFHMYNLWVIHMKILSGVFRNCMVF